MLMNKCDHAKYGLFRLVRIVLFFSYLFCIYAYFSESLHVFTIFLFKQM